MVSRERLEPGRALSQREKWVIEARDGSMQAADGRHERRLRGHSPETSGSDDRQLLTTRHQRCDQRIPSSKLRGAAARPGVVGHDIDDCRRLSLYAMTSYSTRDRRREA